MIKFEKALRQQPKDEWEEISIDELRKVTSAEERQQMIYHLAIVRVGDYKYRKHVPTNTKDWSKSKR